MAAKGLVQELHEELSCSICLEYFQDPVTIAECGHNFCRACLTQSWKKALTTRTSCPQCRGIAQPRNLRQNQHLANVIEIARKLSLQGAKESETKRVEGHGKICNKHQEPLKLFCKEDQILICVVCDKSKEHKSHEVIPLEEAFQEYKDKFHANLKILREERAEILAHKADIMEESQDLLEQTKSKSQKIAAEFRKLHQFLEEQEKLLLGQMKYLENEIARKTDEHLASLSSKLSCLESLIRDMEEKQQQPAIEVLQDVRSTLQRYEEKPKVGNLVAFPPELKWRIWDVRDISFFLEIDVEQFKVNVTLDPDTAHPQLALSEDWKSVRWKEEYQDLPNNPERFDFRPFVLGCEGFTAGQHSWEVFVGNEDGWTVGVARKSLKRKGWITFSPEEGIWAMGRWVDGYYAVKQPHFFPLSVSEEPKRILVSLDYEGWRVTFLDADKATVLYEFLGASFSGETLLPFFGVNDGAHLRLSP
uniref:E3 ubiquitin-protein ligase TRIM7-like n=1 Tax=Euleptes europaea TaxID=460621 RepID=UPI00253FEC27|nr:E3 ubiquitin-protein ligase TRIM7-like [Euleptes europaea]